MKRKYRIGLENRLASKFSDVFDDTFLSRHDNPIFAGNITSDGNGSDIISPSGWSLHVILKAKKSFSFDELLTSECRTMDKWINQYDCVREGKSSKMCVICFYTSRKWYVAYPVGFMLDHDRVIHYKKMVISSLDHWFDKNADIIRTMCKWESTMQN